MVTHRGLAKAAQGTLLSICASQPAWWSGVASPMGPSTVLDATSAGYCNDPSGNVLSIQPRQLPRHRPPPPAPRLLPGNAAQTSPLPNTPTPLAFASNLAISNAGRQASAASRVEALRGGSLSCTLAWLPLGTNNELQLCVNADSSNLDPQILQISAQLLPAFAGCDYAQLEEEDLDTRAFPNLVGSAWEDSLFRRSRVSSGQYKGSIAFGVGSSGKLRRRACRVAICAAVACLHPEDFQAADAAAEFVQAFTELVAEARLALSKTRPIGAEAPSAASDQRQGDVDWPQQAEAAPASIASSTREDGQPWADPGNPQYFIEDPLMEAPVWRNSSNNNWQRIISPRSASGSNAANSGKVTVGRITTSNTARDSTRANDGASLPNGVATQPGGTRTAGPWGRPSDDEIFDFIYPFMDIDWDTIEGLEPEVHEA